MTQLTFPTVFDNTMLTAYRTCPQKFYWAYIRRLRLPGESVHLVAGAAFAKGLEVVRKEYFDNKRDFDTALALGGKALVEAYGDFNPGPMHLNKSWDRMLGALGFYFETWPIDRIIVPTQLQPGTKHTIEYSFGVPFPGFTHPETGEPVVYAGRFDMIAKHETLKMLIGEDDKTTSQLGSQWFDKWRLSNQLSGYTWGAHEYGIPLVGFNMRGVSLLKNDYGHGEAIVYRKAWQIKEFVENARKTLEMMKRDWAEGRWQKQWDAACSSYGGCSFINLCDTPTPDDWMDNYQPNTWNPLHSRD